MTLHIHKKAWNTIHEDALSTFPNECCGFLFGKEHAASRIVEVALKSYNTHIENKTQRFEIEPIAYMKAEQFALENQLDFLGIYHSHPNHPAVPSEFDLRKALPYFSYLIIAVTKEAITHPLSWQLNAKHKFFEEQVTLI